MKKYLIVGDEGIEERQVEGIKGVTYSYINGELTIFRGLKAVYTFKDVQPGEVYSIIEQKMSPKKLHKRDVWRMGNLPTTRVHVSQLGIPSKRCDIPLWLLGYKYEKARCYTPEEFTNKLQWSKMQYDFIPEKFYRNVELVEGEEVRYRVAACLYPNCENSRIAAYACPDITNYEIIQLLKSAEVGFVYPKHVVEHVLRMSLGFSDEELKQIQYERPYI